MNSSEDTRLFYLLEALLKELLREVERELGKHPVHHSVPDPTQPARLS